MWGTTAALFVQSTEVSYLLENQPYKNSQAQYQAACVCDALLKLASILESLNEGIQESNDIERTRSISGETTRQPVNVYVEPGYVSHRSTGAPHADASKRRPYEGQGMSGTTKQAPPRPPKP